MKKLSLFIFAILFAAVTMPSKAMQTVNVTKTVTERSGPHSKKDHNKKDRDQVSQLSKDHFIADFGNVKHVVWERTPDFDQATFKKNGKEMIAYYDDMSKLVGTTRIVKFSSLPEKAQKDINDHYKGYKVGAVIFFDDNELNDTNMVLYGTEFEDSDNYFVELNSAKSNIVLEVSPVGDITFFKKIK